MTDLLDTASSLHGVGMSNSVREGLMAFEHNAVYRGGDVGIYEFIFIYIYIYVNIHTYMYERGAHGL